jgi:hypothetical protein
VTERPAHALAPQAPGTRPGDAFNAAADWAAILAPHGWTCLRVDADGVGYWRRPGKDGRGWSATTDHAGSGLLYVFSGNALPFAPGRGYTKFAAHVLLNFAGDFHAAARALGGRASPPQPSRRERTAGPGPAVTLLPPPARPTGVCLPPPIQPAGAAAVVLPARKTGSDMAAAGEVTAGGRP